MLMGTGRCKDWLASHEPMRAGAFINKPTIVCDRLCNAATPHGTNRLRPWMDPLAPWAIKEERQLACSAKGQLWQSVMPAQYLHAGGAQQWLAVGLWLPQDEPQPRRLVVIGRGAGSSKLLPTLSWSLVAASAGGC